MMDNLMVFTIFYSKNKVSELTSLRVKTTVFRK